MLDDFDEQTSGNANPPNFYLTVFIVYFVLIGIASFVGPIFDVYPIAPFHLPVLPLWGDVLLGVVSGLLVVLITRLTAKVWPKFHKLGELLAQMIGEIGYLGAFFVAVCSSFGEEIFFRGFLQQLFEVRFFAGIAYAPLIAVVLTSVIFALLHISRNIKAFYPWTLFAFLVGLLMGGLYSWTGNLIAPILVHFTVNFLNLAAMGSDDKGKNS